MYYQTFTVKSKFSFPTDMLRYDSCFPAYSQDAIDIADSILHLRGFEVELARYTRVKSDQPTTARWESFSCKVSNIETRKV